MRLSPSLAPLLLAAALLAVYAVAQLAAYQGQWLVTISTTTPFVAQPVTVKAYYFDPASGTLYPVECNATLVNETDVLAFWSFNGTPAVLTIRVNSTGPHKLYVTCASPGGESYQTVYQLRAAWPRPVVAVRAPYGRPVNVTVQAPYQYSGVWVHASLCGLPGWGAWGLMKDGVARLTLPPLVEPCPLTVEYLGGSITVNVTPEIPELEVKPSNTTLIVAEEARLNVMLTDEFGVVPVNVTQLLNVSVAGPCEARLLGGGSVEVTGLAPGTCTIRVTATLWPGESLSREATVYVEPPRVALEPVVHCAQLSCVVGAMVSRGVWWPAEARLYVDGGLVAAWRFNTSSFYNSTSVTLDPGDHNVTVVYIGYSPTGWLHILANSTIVNVPRLPVRVDVETLVPEGRAPRVNTTFYTVDIGGARYVVYAYPGDRLHEPVNGSRRIHVIRPWLRVTEHSVEVYNGAPGGVVEAWCLDARGEWRPVLRVALNSSDARFELPGWCLAARAVYRYGWLTIYAYSNEPPLHLAPVVCTAGSPCRLPGGPAVAAVYIDGRVYPPGSNVTLPPGVYTLTVRTVDGFTLTTWLRVAGRHVTVVAWSDGNGWSVVVAGGPATLVLSDGRVVELQPGEHWVPAEPVTAWSPVGPVELIVYKQPVSVERGPTCPGCSGG